jgi:hypothetical protein
MKRRKQPNEPTRRQFTHTLAALAAAPLIASSAQAEEPGADTVVALTALVQARYGKHLKPEQLKALQIGLLRIQFAADNLRKRPLRNSDEPAFSFHADLP